MLTGLDDFEHNMRSIANRVGASIVISSLLIASSLVSMSHRAEWLAVAGFSLAALLGAYMIWRIARRPGEL